MSPLDLQLIIRKVKLVQEDLDKLKGFEKLTLDQYNQSFDKRLQVERLLERIVGRVIDINYHLLKEQFGYLPTDYFDSFISLGEKGVLAPEFAKQLSQSAGLRNALAHEYDRIDDTQIFNSVKNCLTQIPRYLAIVTRLP